MATPAELLESLSDQQRLALEQFTAVTAQDVNEAIPLLTRCEWNVQIAIARFFDGEPAPVAEPAAPLPEPTRRQEALLNSFHDVPPHPARTQRYLEPAPRIVATPESQLGLRPPFLLSVALAPVNLLLGLFSRLYSILSHFVPIIPTLLDRVSSRLSSLSPLHTSLFRRPQLSPQANADRFAKEFEAAYGEHALPLLRTSYARAYDTAKADLKFLLVVPLSSEHPDTDRFIRTVLLSDHVIQDLNAPTSNVLVWAGSVADSETYSVARALRVNKYPAAVLIAHTPAISATNMSVVERISGPVTAEAFQNKIAAAVERHREPLDRVRAQKQDQEATRNLREEQQSAYERSLAKDRERARQKREAEEEKTRAAQEKQAEQDRADQHFEDLEQWRRWRAYRLAPEPAADVKAAARISLRLPDGSRVIRWFDGEQPLEEVYAFAECQVHLEAVGSLEKAPPKPVGFEHTYGFQLVEVMPRRVHALAEGGTVLGRIGRSGNLVTERIEDDDDNDDAGHD